MNFGPVAVNRGWAFDTSWPFNARTAAALLAAPWAGSAKVAIERYVSLGKPSPSDITIQERDQIFIAGWKALGLVQHVEMPHWIATPQKGTDHGKAAVEHAQMVSYPQGCHITPDIEGLGNSGAPVQQYLELWCRQVLDAGFLPLPYDGYDDGMPDAVKLSLVANGFVRKTDWWSDFGPRSLPPGLAWAAKQHVQCDVGGRQVDPDEILVDGVLRFMGIEVDQTAPDSGDPHFDPSGTST